MEISEGCILPRCDWQSLPTSNWPTSMSNELADHLHKDHTVWEMAATIASLRRRVIELEQQAI